MLYKKMFVVFGMMMVLPALAEPTIGYDDGSYTYNESTTNGDNMCIVDVLETYDGPTNLTAGWEANEIKLRWYNVNTQIIPANDSQKTCDYDGTLYLPATPTRTGYTFAGWHVRPLTTFSNSALGTTGTGKERWGKGHIVGTTTPYCYHILGGSSNADQVECNSDSHFIEMNLDEWQVRYNNNGKTLYGMAHCSAKSGNNSDYTWPVSNRSQWETSTISDLDAVSGEKKYCWCKATGYKASSTAVKQGANTSLAWVFSYNRGSSSNCANSCAAACSNHAQSYINFRDALFLGTGTAE